MLVTAIVAMVMHGMRSDEEPGSVRRRGVRPARAVNAARSAARPPAADQRLLELAEQLAPYRVGAAVFDQRWRLVWKSEELDTVLVDSDPDRLAPGAHVLEVWRELASRLTAETARGFLRTNIPFILAADDTDQDSIAEIVGSEFAATTRDLEPQTAPPRWIGSYVFRHDQFFGRAHYIGERVHGEDGRMLGYLFLHHPDLPVSLTTLLVRGDQRMYERMAALLEPSQRPAAILFADLEGSGVISRRLSSSAYFRLVHDIRSAVDTAVAEHGGIIGKHAGDGVTAFFLSHQLQSDSAAARAALETARSLPELVHHAATTIAEDGLPVDADACRLKVAVHWGPGLYIGQVASQGRLEVTALGDEMNEAARIEQSANGGQVLASKALLERLNPTDAAALGVDPTRIAYHVLAHLHGATDKSLRDAGSLAISNVAKPPPAATTPPASGAERAGGP